MASRPRLTLLGIALYSISFNVVIFEDGRITGQSLLLVKLKMNQTFTFKAIVLALFILPCITQASGGTGEYELPWPIKSESLIYHSCGCADSCWVAEVRDRQNHRVLFTLRCDCEMLFFSAGNSGERPLNESCKVVNTSNNKAAEISSNLRRTKSKRLHE